MRKNYCIAILILLPHCNFGSENRVAQVAKALNVPVLLCGPRDDAPDEQAFAAEIRSAVYLLQARC